MFGINGPEFFLLLIIGVLVIGPQRLPEYTQKLANLVKEVRRMASGAREQIKEEVGIDIDDVDWKKYDPRQYDPRRIIKEALLEDVPEPDIGINDVLIQVLRTGICGTDVHIYNWDAWAQHLD